MLVKHYPELFRDEPETLARAQNLAARTRELSAFLAESRRRPRRRRAFRRQGRDARFLLGPARTWRPRGAARAAGQRWRARNAIELNDAEVCCGFGGTFCVKYPDISARMVTDKADAVIASGADVLVSGDLGCLMNIAGRLKRMDSPVRVYHLAELLAGMTDAPGIGDGRQDMKPTSARLLRQRPTGPCSDVTLQQALAKAGVGFVDKRRAAVSELPEFDGAARGRPRDQGPYAGQPRPLPAALRAAGAGVRRRSCTGPTRPHEACAAVLDICRDAGARLVAKGKSMVGEEIAVNDALEAAGLEVVETDLGEYIIQIAHEPPSHIIAPAVHKTRPQIADCSKSLHHQPDLTRPLETVPQIVDEARQVLRDNFLAADVGITGANFLIAETGSTVIVTNEGNGDLSATLPRVHIVLASIEKVVPNLEDASVLLRLLARSATGQEITSYTTFFTGPRRARRPRRSRAVPRGAGRQRPQPHARRRLSRDAALHPLRRLPQPLSRSTARWRAMPTAGSTRGRWARCSRR